MSARREILTPLALYAPEFQQAVGTADVVIAVNAQQPDYGAPLYSRVLPRYEPGANGRHGLVWPEDAGVLRVPVDIGGDRSEMLLLLEVLVLAGQRAAEAARRAEALASGLRLVSFHSETWPDLVRFAAMARASLIAARTVSGLELTVEMTTTADVASLKALCDLVEDGHVMRETLRACPLSENNLERKYDDDE